MRRDPAWPARAVTRQASPGPGPTPARRNHSAQPPANASAKLPDRPKSDCLRDHRQGRAGQLQRIVRRVEHVGREPIGAAWGKLFDKNCRRLACLYAGSRKVFDRTYSSFASGFQQDPPLVADCVRGDSGRIAHSLLDY